jgi:hypothetical protein
LLVDSRTLLESPPGEVRTEKDAPIDPLKDQPGQGRSRETPRSKALEKLYEISFHDLDFTP